MALESVETESYTGCVLANDLEQLARPDFDLLIDAETDPLWLVHTKPRNEKALAADLDAMGIGYYLPLVRTPRRYGGRTTTVDLPLFPSYLFLCGDVEQRYAALATRRAVSIFEVIDDNRLRAELRHVRQVTQSDEAVELYPGLRRGRRCRVTQGSLRGIEGVVLRRRGVCRVYLGVQVLGLSAELEIDPSLLEIIE